MKYVVLYFGPPLSEEELVVVGRMADYLDQTRDRVNSARCGPANKVVVWRNGDGYIAGISRPEGDTIVILVQVIT